MIEWKLDAWMQAHNVKGRDLARRMNIGENYLSRVRHEVPDRLSLSLLESLCRELGCGIGDLLEYRPATRGRKSAGGGKKVAPAAPRPKAPAPKRHPEAEPESDFVQDVLVPLMAEMPPPAAVAKLVLPRRERAPVEPVAQPVAEPVPETSAGGAATLRRGSALQARLEELKRRRQSE
ncbi:MAG: helix-turn-helix transcriptional regulator [Candidatus Sericytochromatia bacterium]|nr:helix-turn-helix transcriptional regulator [Candidatus Sericytochromatia bacterium]